MHRNIRGKRSAPSRGTLEWVHRFIYYKGYYFEFFGKYNTVAEKDGKAYLLVISKARVAVMQAETILILGHFIQVNKKMTNYRKILVSKRLISRMLGRSTKSSVYQNKWICKELVWLKQLLMNKRIFKALPFPSSTDTTKIDETTVPLIFRSGFIVPVTSILLY